MWQNIGNDVSMSRKMQADNKAFIYFIEEKLRPAYVSFWIMVDLIDWSLCKLDIWTKLVL